MQNYKDLSGGVHVLDDAAFYDLLPAGCVEITQAQADALTSAANAPSAAQVWAAYQLTAQDAIDKTSVTLERCFENGIALPAAWVEYRKALRAILSAKSGDATAALPARPAYPAGT